MKSLQDHKALVPLPRDDVDDAIEYIRNHIDWDGLARSAVHDLFSGIMYFDSIGLSQRTVLRCESTNSSYISFLGYCPSCSHRDSNTHWTPIRAIKDRIIRGNKPTSDQIGKICSDVTLKILRTILSSEAQISVIGGQHEVDAIIKSGEIISLWEIKSSPLFLPAFTTQHLNGEHHSITEQTVENPGIIIPGTNRIFRIPPSTNLGTSQRNLRMLNTDIWLEFVESFISSWSIAYAQYRNRFTGENNSFQLLVCSGSSKTDDSKNHPGINRTDDIKKGTYQSLKFAGKYKRHCISEAVFGGLISNVRPLQNRLDDYISEILDLNIEMIEGAQRPLCDAILSLDDPFGECLYDVRLRNIGV